MILTEMWTAQIPEIYKQFADIVGDSYWKKRVALLRQEIKGNRFLTDYIQRENSIAFQLESLRELIAKFGSVPPWEINNHAIYPAVSFAAQALSIMEALPRKLAEQFKRRIHGAFKNPDDMRGLRLELSAATHFARRGLKISWPEMSGIGGTFDLLIEGLGPQGLEVECKSISEDKGRKIPKQEVLNFYNLLWPHLESTRKGLAGGLSVVLTIPGRLPTEYKDRMALAKQVGTYVFLGKSATLPNGSSIRITEFDIKRLGKIPLATNPQELRTTVDGVTETTNRQTMLIGTNAGGALALAVQSTADDTFMKAIFDTLSDSAKRQFSSIRGGMFLTGLQGLNAEQLRSIAGQDDDLSQESTALRIAVSKFLSGTGRDHVIGVGFLSENDLVSADEGIVESGGTAYYFPKRESPLWSDDFSGLFSWSNNNRSTAPLLVPA